MRSKSSSSRRRPTKRSSSAWASRSASVLAGVVMTVTLSDDLDADQIFGRLFARRLVSEDGLEGGDRDRELLEIGLAGGELLQLHAGPHEDLHPAPAAVLAGELDDLERDPGDERHAE